MFYLTTHSTHFIYEGRKFLFNAALNTFYLQLYGFGKKTTQIVREETHRHHYISFSFQLAAMVLLYAHHPDRIAHTMTFVTPVVEHWLE